MIITWIIILVAVLGMLFIGKLSHIKHRLSIILLILFLLLIYLSFVRVAGGSSVDLKSASGFFDGIKLYFSWLGHLFANMKIITGNAVRMEWFGNATG